MAHGVRDAAGRFSTADWVSGADKGEMVWTAVGSSNVAAVGYNAGTSTLGVTFHNGSSYEYHAVPHDIYEGLIGAQSVGKYLHYYVKGSFAYERVA